MPPNPVLLARYRRQLAHYRALTSTALVTAWDRLESYDEVDVPKFAEATAPLLMGVKVASVAMSAGFFASTLRLRPVAVNPADIKTVPDFASPFHAYWHALKEARPWDEAHAAGRSIAGTIGDDFVTSTSRRTGDVVAEASGRRVRWARVPGPNACEWCETVAGDHYATAESADFGHKGCDCQVVPA